MPRTRRPATTGYERLAQAEIHSDDDSDDNDNDNDLLLSRNITSIQPQSASRSAAIAAQPVPRSGMTSPKTGTGVRRLLPHQHHNQHHNYNYSHNYSHRRRHSSAAAGVDLKAINARLERWADEITARFKRRRGRDDDDNIDDDERIEIHYSVFQAPDGVRPATAATLAAAPPPTMTRAEFDAIVDSVRLAIDQNVHPSMISQGSSGSYFARDPDGKVVGVFKPKDEEPYAAGNPKWNKWIHRNLFPCCFGRAWYVWSVVHRHPARSC